MLFGNKRHVQNSKPSDMPKAETMYVDSQLRSAVAREFLRMDRQHDRIREEALAASGVESNQAELMGDQELS
ncbi:MAG TPA: hypothetical protein VFH15_09680 [Pyrinomonadaceae bacterium]|nr:hypothetical protein [Pyrinomonadaceae bacterium]